MKYEKPEMIVLKLKIEEVICTSLGEKENNDDEGNYDDNGDIW